MPDDDALDSRPTGLADRAYARIADAQAVLADRLDAEAERLGKRRPGAPLAARGAAALENAAYGLREHDMAAVIVAADTRVRRAPWAMIGLALALGTVVGLTLNRNRLASR